MPTYLPIPWLPVMICGTSFRAPSAVDRRSLKTHVEERRVWRRDELNLINSLCLCWWWCWCWWYLTDHLRTPHTLDTDQHTDIYLHRGVVVWIFSWWTLKTSIVIGRVRCRANWWQTDRHQQQQVTENAEYVCACCGSSGIIFVERARAGGKSDLEP